MNPLVYFWLFLKASLFSTGGMGNLPSLHSDLLARHWANERQFAEALTIGQLSPGPNGLWVVGFGYLTDGLTGSLLALAAIIIPPLLILVVEKLYRRVQDHPAVEGFMHGLGLAVAGIFVVVLTRLIQPVGLSMLTIGIILASIGLAATKRVPIVVIIALAGLAGAIGT